MADHGAHDSHAGGDDHGKSAGSVDLKGFAARIGKILGSFSILTVAFLQTGIWRAIATEFKKYDLVGLIFYDRLGMKENKLWHWAIVKVIGLVLFGAAMLLMAKIGLVR